MDIVTYALLRSEIDDFRYLQGISIKGVLANENDLPISPDEQDAYIVNKHLYVFHDGEWVSTGSLKGEKGDVGGVNSVNEKDGEVRIDKKDIGLSNVDNKKQATPEMLTNQAGIFDSKINDVKKDLENSQNQKITENDGSAKQLPKGTTNLIDIDAGFYYMTGNEVAEIEDHPTKADGWFFLSFPRTGKGAFQQLIKASKVDIEQYYRTWYDEKENASDWILNVTENILEEHTKEDSGKHINSSSDNYIRFDDGTQVCYSHITLGYYSGRTMNASSSFPRSFKNTPVVVGSIDTKEEVREEFRLEDLAEPYIHDISNSNYKVGIKVNPAGGKEFKKDDLIGFNIIAYGKWK